MNLIKSGIILILAYSSLAQADWLKEPLWDEGMAEVSLYEGKKLRYAELRNYTMDLITVREHFDKSKMVKTSPQSGVELLPVMKQNMVLKFRTGIYEYRQMASVFINRDRAQLEKFSVVSGEWCGNSSVSLVRKGEHFHSFIQNYMDNFGISTAKIPHSDAIFYDEIIPYLKQNLESLPQSLKIIPSLVHNSPVLQDAVEVVVSSKKEKDTRVVKLRNLGETFIFEDSPSRKLLHWKNKQGEFLKLRKSMMVDYWNKHHEGGEKLLK